MQVPHGTANQPKDGGQQKPEDGTADDGEDASRTTSMKQEQWAPSSHSKIEVITNIEGAVNDEDLR